MPPTIERCWDVTEAHVLDALASRHGMAKLLAEMAAVARPAAGAAKILIVLARMAHGGCDWLEGELRVELEASDKAMTSLSVMEDLGGGVRERVFPRYRLAVPLEEFERGLKMAPTAIEPLQGRLVDGKMILTVGKSRKSNAPPSFEVAEDSLRKSLPPKVRKTLAPPKSSDRKSKPTKDAGSPVGMMFEIPRAPKTLDLSVLDTGPREARPAPPPPTPRPRPALRRRSAPPKKG